MRPHVLQVLLRSTHKDRGSVTHDVFNYLLLVIALHFIRNTIES